MDRHIEHEKPRYSISEAAEMLDISVHTLRMYEKNYLFVPFQRESRQRRFSDHDIERIRCIRNSINQKKLSIEAIKVIYSLIPCWEIINCTKDERQKCPAFNSHGNPCWSFSHKDNICKKIECRECTVYKEYSDCHIIKETIKKFTVTK